ncbi:MAG: hypothetical protein AAF532_02150 [Planctomycetota bacterium]
MIPQPPDPRVHPFADKIGACRLCLGRDTPAQTLDASVSLWIYRQTITPRDLGNSFAFSTTAEDPSTGIYDVSGQPFLNTAVGQRPSGGQCRFTGEYRDEDSAFETEVFSTGFVDNGVPTFGKQYGRVITYRTTPGVTVDVDLLANLGISGRGRLLVEAIRSGVAVDVELAPNFPDVPPFAVEQVGDSFSTETPFYGHPMSADRPRCHRTEFTRFTQQGQFAIHVPLIGETPGQILDYRRSQPIRPDFTDGHSSIYGANRNSGEFTKLGEVGPFVVPAGKLGRFPEVRDELFDMADEILSICRNTGHNILSVIPLFIDPRVAVFVVRANEPSSVTLGTPEAAAWTPWFPYVYEGTASGTFGGNLDAGGWTGETIVRATSIASSAPRGLLARGVRRLTPSVEIIGDAV